MRAYRSLFKIRFIHNIQYRGALLGSILKGFTFAFMEILAIQLCSAPTGMQRFL